MDSKRCTTCQEVFPLTDFVFKDKPAGIRKASCKFCTRARGKQNYEADKESHVERSMRNKLVAVARNRAFVDKHLEHTECACCSAVVNLTFYSGGPNSGNQPVHMAVNHGVSLAAVQSALSNSVVFCKSCLGDLFASGLGEWRFASHEQRLKIKAQREKEGHVPVPRAVHKRYVPVASADAPSEEGAPPPDSLG